MTVYIAPLDSEGNPLTSQMVPIQSPTVEFKVADEPDDDERAFRNPLIPDLNYMMELHGVDVAALQPFFSPEPREGDKVQLEFGDHRIEGHLTYVGEEMHEGKMKQRYDMLDGVFLCGPHDSEGNHIMRDQSMRESDSASPSE